jgi:hypothetical protein
LKDPVAKNKFMSGTAIEGALESVPPSANKKQRGLAGDIAELAEIIKRYPWTTLSSLKGDQQVIRQLEETEQLLKELKKALSRK